ncbi:Mv-ORF122 peptide [Maruca vitrata nucleopolyhedrovirus]|uniref:Mv-ORF122 peptide n=1 Tax=Maruca vitrata nucleopolyhedrovirus TaxID=1307954 RepID=A1YRI4_9ABAC|nr:Mv-ORF122 peptide [Maruca vitrata nucleopolyhedrovirus]ABM05438.1 Mv-ORF122 peptide [Maruca vitrata nucleopolyhedrovirus]
MDSNNCIKIDAKYDIPSHYQYDNNVDKDISISFDVDPNKTFIINHNYIQQEQNHEQLQEAATYNSCIIIS